MTAYILRRLLATIPVMVVVAIFVFFLLRLAPGDPAAIIAGEDATAAQIAAVRMKLGLDRPVFEQFVVWFGAMLQGDFGTSIFSNLPVSRAHHAAHRADVVAHALDAVRRRGACHPARCSGGVEGARVDRPGRDVVCRNGLRDAGVSHRLRADLYFRGQTRLAPGAGLHADPRRALAVGGKPHPSLTGARHHLYGADRAHHAGLDAGGAGAGLHPHRTSKGLRPTACFCCMP